MMLNPATDLCYMYIYD